MTAAVDTLINSRANAWCALEMISVGVKTWRPAVGPRNSSGSTVTLNRPAPKEFWNGEKVTSHAPPSSFISMISSLSLT